MLDKKSIKLSVIVTVDGNYEAQLDSTLEPVLIASVLRKVILGLEREARK